MHANAQGDPKVAEAAMESPAGRHGTCKHTPVREVQRMTCHVGERNQNNNNKTVTGSGKSASALTNLYHLRTNVSNSTD